MLKKMRRRFTVAAMGAFLMVTLVLLLTVNLWNYFLSTQKQDETLELLESFDPWQVDTIWVPGSVWAHLSSEAQYTTRFFEVRCDENGRVTGVYHEYIESISASDAVEYAKAVEDRGRSSGYYKGYRFSVDSEGRGKTYVFLNVERELQSMKSLMMVSGIVALASAVAAYVLVRVFSKRAIAPYVRNIETQKRFITDASHELKTPLTAISTSADVLSMELADNEWVQNIHTQTNRLSRLITDLVTLSRLDEERPFPAMSDFSLSDAVWEVAEPMEALAKAKGKTYSQDIQDGLTLHGDREAISQLVSILLDNALKYSDDGGIIRLDVRKRQRKIEISVFNTCQLEDYKHTERLFDRFYRPDESRSKETGGTGIGLAVAKATAEAHGGRIRAESPDGKSVTFTVTL